MPKKLYYSPSSGPCRSVILTARMLEVELELVLVNLLAGDQLKPEFIAKNPQHNVPTLDDDGFYINESRVRPPRFLNIDFIA